MNIEITPPSLAVSRLRAALLVELEDGTTVRVNLRIEEPSFIRSIDDPVDSVFFGADPHRALHYRERQSVEIKLRGLLGLTDDDRAPLVIEIPAR